MFLICVCACVCVRACVYVDAANHGRSIHEEIDTIVDAAFNNMLNSAGVDNEDNKSPRQAGVSSSYPSHNEHNLDRSHERGHRKNVHKDEKQGSASVDVTQQHNRDMRLKGDVASDETSWKQWKEQRQQTDLRKKRFHETGEALPQENSNDHKASYVQDSMQDTGSSLETTDRGFSTMSEDQPGIFDASSNEKETQSFSVSESSGIVSNSDEEHNVSHDHADEVESPTVNITADGESRDRENSQNVREEQIHKTEDSDSIVLSGTVGSSEEHRGVRHDLPEETDISETAAVEIAVDEDSVDRENFQNVEDEQSLQTEDADSIVPYRTVGSSGDEHDVSHDLPEETSIPESPAVKLNSDDDSVGRENFRTVVDEQLQKTEVSDSVVSSEMTTGDLENDSKKEEHAGKESFHENTSREADAVDELAEELSSNHDSDDIQTEWRSETDVLDEAVAADNIERQVTVTEDDRMVVEHDVVPDNDDPTFQNEEHADLGSESDLIDEELPHSTDEGSSEIPPALDGGSVDVVPDDGNTSWSFSTLSSIFSAVDTVIDMVRHKKTIFVFIF